MVELMLKSRTGKYITFFKPHAVGDFKEIVDSLPLDTALARVKGFVTRDQSMLANVFEFGTIDYPTQDQLEALAKDIYEFAEEVREGKVSTNEWNDCYERESLENTTPDRILRHMLMWEQTKGTDDCIASVRSAAGEVEGGESQHWVTVCASNVHPHSELVRISAYLTAKRLKINRVHLDRVKDKGGDKCLVRVLAEPLDKFDSEMSQAMLADLPRLKYLDDDVL